ncbi:AGAP005405-PA-like protein [Anopheles sinensis]|uniref:AGAP005405-PA-like protein n=1 Tax=Anopheles sinensis TaxID=74873 RepID=A0A084VDG6_ANOSI|nr:AGAP005405-PA-like protein [Anopheles sinensis]
MAVCVVCLLCADHVPCKQHFGDEPSGREAGRGSHTGTHTVLGKAGHDQLLTDHQRQLAAAFDSVTAYRDQRDEHRIVKRHHHHGHDDVDHEHGEHDEQETEFNRLLKVKVDQFVKKIFTEFGNPETMTMGVKGFESMMQKLDMYRLVSDGGAKEGSEKSRAGSSTSLNLINGQNEQAQQADAFKDTIAGVGRGDDGSFK